MCKDTVIFGVEREKYLMSKSITSQVSISAIGQWVGEESHQELALEQIAFGCAILPKVHWGEILNTKQQQMVSKYIALIGHNLHQLIIDLTSLVPPWPVSWMFSFKLKSQDKCFLCTLACIFVEKQNKFSLSLIIYKSTSPYNLVLIQIFTFYLHNQYIHCFFPSNPITCPLSFMLMFGNYSGVRICPLSPLCLHLVLRHIILLSAGGKGT